MNEPHRVTESMLMCPHPGCYCNAKLRIVERWEPGRATVEVGWVRNADDVIAHVDPSSEPAPESGDRTVIMHKFEEREDGRCKCGGEAHEHAIVEHPYYGDGGPCRARVPAGIGQTEVCGYPLTDHLVRVA